MDIETLSLVIAVATLVVTVATLIFSVTNSKGYISRKIDKKQWQIHQIDDAEIRKYGVNGRFPRVITPEDERKEKLQSEINTLQRKL